MLLPVIKRGLTISPKTAEPEQQPEQTEITAQPEPPPKQPEQKPAVSEKPATPAPPPKTPEKEPEKTPNAKPQNQPENKPQTEKPTTPALPSAPPVQPASPQPVKPAETRGSIYLLSNGILVKVNRNFNASTPLTDSINALLAGPTPDEIMRGIESLVPEGSRLLKTPTIKGGTVELDFNQEFRYNTRGSEGCAAQIKQIVWTATEFPNVRDVQFLIDGQKVDFLSEGVTIRNPIGRY